MSNKQEILFQNNKTDIATSVLDVVIDSPLRKTFDYLPEQGKTLKNYQIGCRVIVPFGSRKVMGIVVGINSSSVIEPEKIKQIEKTLDNTPFFNVSELALANWISQYYQHPIGDTYFNLLPKLLKLPKGESSAYEQRVWKITTHGLGLPKGALTRAKKQQSLLQYLRELSTIEHAILPTDTRLKELGHTIHAARELAKKGLIESALQGYVPAHCNSLLQGKAVTSSYKLNAEQEIAINEIKSTSTFKVHLLEGVTGSGKTEIYLQTMQDILNTNKQIIVLVPEIGLTPQTIERFSHRFKVNIAVLHSGLTDKERLIAWQAAKDNQAKIIIGTRSAVFAPLSEPGLIIVDEEHDLSYKQQEGLRYSARDVAIMRARLLDIPVILGSATPSLETLQNALNNKYSHLQLTQRASTSTTTRIELLDTRKKQLHQGLCEESIELINQTISKKEQCLVFINRRGFAPLLMCQSCNWQAICPQCDARLTYHQANNKLICHHCDYQSYLPSECPRCQSNQILQVGFGTERCTNELQKLFPNIPVIRIDKDSTSNKGNFNQALDNIQSNKAMIIVGTQMLAKGHHFENLSSAIILDIDQGLYYPDFRAMEKTLQLLTQVTGRVGRSQKISDSKVIIQTQLPDHPQLQQWIQGGYQLVSRTLLEERQLRQLPPFGYIAVIRADSSKPNESLQFLEKAAQSITNQLPDSLKQNIKIVGPLAANMEKRAGRHRAQLMFKSANRQILQNILSISVEGIEKLKKPHTLRWSVDVDAQEV